jgi:hypothetical protein
VGEVLGGLGDDGRLDGLAGDVTMNPASAQTIRKKNGETPLLSRAGTGESPACLGW